VCDDLVRNLTVQNANSCVRYRSLFLPLKKLSCLKDHRATERKMKKEAGIQLNSKSSY